MMAEQRDFMPLNIAILTVSDTRSEADDTSGRVLVERLQAAGHRLAEKQIVPDDIYSIRAVISRWIADETVNAVLTTGGTGVTGRDGTPEAIQALLDKQIEGFGELFRMLSWEEIKTSTGWPTGPTFFACQGPRVPAAPVGTASSRINWTTDTGPAIWWSCCRGCGKNRHYRHGG
jgi:molybdenum cofactor synthesis domain-containing protein